MISKNGTTILIDSFNTSGKVNVFVKAKTVVNSVVFKVLKENIVINESFNSDSFSFSFIITNPILWDINNPYLYEYELELDDEKITGSFGFRTLSHNEKNVFLNDRAIFIKGYIRGAAAHEHQNNLNLSEIEFYRKNIRQAKKYGFNLIRFHSVVPSEALFTAADEEGILIHLELRQPNDDYNNLEEMLFSKKDLVPNAFIDYVINSYYNHPSLAVYCIGNEIKGLDADKRSDEIGKYIKHRDPNRLFLDTCAWGKLDRPNIDIDVQHLSYFFPYGIHSDMYSNPKTIHTLKDQLGNLKDNESPFHVPLIAHEICHYAALRDFKALKKKCLDNNVTLPWWIDEEIKLIKEKGYSDDEYQKMYEASKYFQYICWKEAFERIRKSPILGGFHFLQFADTDKYENSNGVVDFFDDSNYVIPLQFLSFNDELVLLTDLKKIYSSDEEIEINISTSNYLKEIKEATLKYCLSDEKEVIVTGEVTISNIKIGNSDLYSLRINLPNVCSSSKYVFKVSLKVENKKYSNEWPLWIYPKYPTSTYKEFVNISNASFEITDDIERALSNLEKGKKTVLIYRSDWTRHLLNKNMPSPKYAFRATWNRFKPVIWDRGTNFGGLVKKELLNKYGFFTSEYYDFNYSVISEDSDKIILDDFPIKVCSLITGIDKCNRDRFDAYKVSFNLPELMPDRTLRHFSYLFELKVNNTPLLVCGLNLTHIDENEPSTIEMKNFIEKYASSDDFDPQNNIDLDTFKNYLSQCAYKPVKERMMTQYWELDDAPVESKEYWISSREYLLEDEKK
ncbi:MAG: hypothetical protein J6M95_01665 [Bacilli bacterium]|nr:hypothetical protein [Bacilli bacterium]